MSNDWKDWAARLPLPGTVTSRNAQAVLDYVRENKATVSLANQSSELRQTIQVVAAIGRLPENAPLPAVNEDMASFVIHTSIDKLKQLSGRIDGPMSGEKLVSVQRILYKRAFETATKNELKAFFDGLERLDLIELMARSVASHDSVLPISAQRALKSWAKAKEAAMHAEREHDHDINVVEVDTLLPAGELESADAPALTHGPAAEAGEIRPQPRLKWVIEALKQDGVKLEGMTLYREKDATALSGKAPYNVLEVAGGGYQIAVCDYVGFATYIIRQPKDFLSGDSDAAVTVADLKNDKSVYQINCYSPEQYIRNLRHYAHTPLDRLAEQLKTRLYWADKKAAVLESFGKFYAETKQIPKTDDDTILEHGALAGRTTMRRLYHALNRRAIAGLEGVRNFPDLRQLCEEAPQAAEAPAFLFDVGEVFARAAEDALNNALPFDPALDRAFAEGRVKDLEKLELEPATGIRTTLDFLHAAGLAQSLGDGTTIPAAENIVRRIMRLTALQLGSS